MKPILALSLLLLLCSTAWAYVKENPDKSKYVLRECGDYCIRWFDPVSRNFYKDGAAGTAYYCDEEKIKKLLLNL